MDRSRVEAGRRCARLRWLSFHAEAEEDERTGLKVLGGYGRGLRTTAASLPLVTGTHTHSIFANLLLYHKRWEQAPKDQVAAAEWAYCQPDADLLVAGAEGIIRRVVDEYKAQTAPFLEVMERTTEEGEAAVEEQRRTVREQAWLVECLGWVMALRVVPALMETWEVVEVETEAEFDLDETILFMPRPDAVVRHRRSGRLAVLDLKTTSDSSSKWFNDQWQTTPQLNVACRGVAIKHGEECTSYYVLALDKGYRKQDKDYGEFSGPVKQQSPLCYAFLRELPMQPQEWRVGYYVPAVNEDGTARISPRTGKQMREGSTEKQGWRKVAVWEHAASARAYVEALPEAFIGSIARLIGPIECKNWLIDSYVNGIQAEEYRVWIPLAQRMVEAQERGAGQEERHEILDDLAPQSWACQAFGRACEFRDCCLRTPGGLEKFAPRVPHHEAEAERFREIYGAEGVAEEREE